MRNSRPKSGSRLMAFRPLPATSRRRGSYTVHHRSIAPPGLTSPSDSLQRLTGDIAEMDDHQVVA